MLAFCACFVALGLPLLFLYENVSLSRLLLLAAISAAANEIVADESADLKLRVALVVTQGRMMLTRLVGAPIPAPTEGNAPQSDLWW